MRCHPLRLDEVAAATGGRLENGSPEDTCTGVCVDSREAEAGDLFVAVAGQRADGHRFLTDAARRGAVAALVERGRLRGEPPPGLSRVVVANTTRALGDLALWHRNRFAPRVVGVTGSVGKTSAKEACAAVLGARWRTLKSEGNRNTEYGLPMTLLRLGPEHGAAVLEMAMRARGEVADLCRVARPQAGVVTNVGPTHLELLGSLDEIAAAKRELPAALPRDGWAILNFDDPRVAAMAAHTDAAVVGYGLGPAPSADVPYVTAAGPIAVDAEGRARFRLRLPDGVVDGALPVPGRHQVYHALAAAALGWCLGLQPEEVAAGLRAWRQPGGRTALRSVAGVRLIDDTYNAAPASVCAALDLLDDLAAAGRGDASGACQPPAGTPTGRRIAVLGDMLELGDLTAAAHRQVGEAAAAHRVDWLLTVGKRARGIAAAARRAGMPADRVLEFAANGPAAERLAALLAPGDTVLVKGSRGMAMEEIVAAVSTALLRPAR